MLAGFSVQQRKGTLTTFIWYNHPKAINIEISKTFPMWVSMHVDQYMPASSHFYIVVR